MPLAELAAPAARLAREGVVLNAGQAYIAKILADLLTSTPECAALWAPAGHVLREGELLRNPELGDALSLLGQEGAEPFYRGDIAAAVCDWLSRARRLARRARSSPATARSSASPCGCAIATARCSPTRRRRPAGRCSPTRSRCWTAVPRRRRWATSSRRWGPRRPSARRSSSTGSASEGFLERFLARRLGSTTHISVLDADGRACSVTCTNGEGSGVVVPGTEST